MKLPSGECHKTSLIISKYWFSYWLGATRQQAITWASVEPDPCHHIASPSHNELTVDFMFNQSTNIYINIYILYIYIAGSTYWGHDRMVDILQVIFFKCIFLNQNYNISIQISLKFVPIGPIQIMACLNQWWISSCIYASLSLDGDVLLVKFPCMRTKGSSLQKRLVSKTNGNFVKCHLYSRNVRTEFCLFL